MDYACQRLRHLRVELPAERELQRVVDAALKGFFQDIHRRIAEAIPAEVRNRIDDLLVGPGSGVFSAFEQLKVDPGRPGVDNLQAEIAKLRAIRIIGLGNEPFAGVPLQSSPKLPGSSSFLVNAGWACCLPWWGPAQG